MSNIDCHDGNKGNENVQRRYDDYRRAMMYDIKWYRDDDELYTGEDEYEDRGYWEEDEDEKDYIEDE
jgi:hypothetical protein